MMNGKRILDQFRDGVITNNPVFVQLLGTCPSLATTTSAANALGMGISVIFVLVFSNFFISLLRKFIPNQIRIASYIVIISGFVSMLELIIKAYLPTLDNALGLFIPLILSLQERKPLLRRTRFSPRLLTDLRWDLVLPLLSSCLDR